MSETEAILRLKCILIHNYDWAEEHEKCEELLLNILEEHGYDLLIREFLRIKEKKHFGYGKTYL